MKQDACTQLVALVSLPAHGSPTDKTKSDSSPPTETQFASPSGTFPELPLCPSHLMLFIKAEVQVVSKRMEQWR
jgi:hypothetical protein